MSLQRPHGFTLVELSVVVAMIGIIAAIAIPNYRRMTCRAKQTEAKSAIKQIQMAEESYRAEHDHYVNGSDGALKTTGQALNDSKARYTYGVLAPTNSTFQAEAFGEVADVLNDDWLLTENGALQHPYNACTGALTSGTKGKSPIVDDDNSHDNEYLHSHEFEKSEAYEHRTGGLRQQSDDD